ncbi:MAG: glycosyltransferase family 2 protein [Ruminococcus flavefaciens]|nr:glycosyltransferase family 2 protein [Ruminococcus flavefaciens]
MCELTILMPCLNEAETLLTCIKKARKFLEENGVEGEILVADNGSTDGSREIALRGGARVVNVSEKGYGSALIRGSESAKGKYVIMGDSDDSYDFLNLMPFLEKLRDGYDLVMGNRFLGGIDKGAMPWSHRYIGNPLLSFIGRSFFQSEIRDFHCGLRGYNRESIRKLHLKTRGMEYASEMVVKAELYHLRITEVPTTLRKDGRSRAPHLRSFRDGWRHLKFLFMYAPNWLFLYPGMIMFMIGAVGSVILTIGQFMISQIVLSIHTLLYCMSFIVIGFNIIDMFLLVKLYAYNHHFLPRESSVDWNDKLQEDRFMLAGVTLILLGVILSVCALGYWRNLNYSELMPEIMMRIVIPAVTFLQIGVQAVFSGFMIGILKIKTEDC